MIDKPTAIYHHGGNWSTAYPEGWFDFGDKMNKEYMLLEFDLAGAEWVVVAYLTGDKNMLGVVQSGKSPHIVTGSLMTGAPEDIVLLDHKLVDKLTDPVAIEAVRSAHPEIGEACSIFLPRSMSIRQAGKKSNHGLNYDMKYKRYALENEIEEREAMLMVDSYKTKAYPGIPEWHRSIQKELRDNDRCLWNCFGRKVRLLDEWGPELFDAAYSFKPQSTIGDISLQGMCAAYEDDAYYMRMADLLTQTHDSVTYQYPVGHWKSMARFVSHMMYRHLRPELEYNGYKFYINSDLKVGRSWGHMIEVKVEEGGRLDEHLEAAWATIQSRDPLRTSSQISLENVELLAATG